METTNKLTCSASLHASLFPTVTHIHTEVSSDWISSLKLLLNSNGWDTNGNMTFDPSLRRNAAGLTKTGSVETNRRLSSSSAVFKSRLTNLLPF